MAHHYDIVITETAVAWSRICPTTGGGLIETAGVCLEIARQRFHQAVAAAPAGHVIRLMDEDDFTHEFHSTH